MIKESTYLIKAVGVVCIISGIIWSLGLAVREQPNYSYISIAGILVLIGVFSIAFSMRNDEKWMTL
ncbi:MAG: hypothetical protein AABW64_03660 [Nanoarchaeota archaeon]